MPDPAVRRHAQAWVRRKIVPLTHQYSGKKAIFELTDDYFRVVIPARTAP